MKQATKLICLIFILIFLLPSCSPALSLTEEKTVEETKTEATEETTAEENEKTEDDPPQIMQKSDPKEDDVFNLLMIGNSFSYYYVEELYGMAKAAGVNMKVCNLYYSGCRLEQHWEWFHRDESPYDYYTTDEKGRQGKKNVSLRTALRQENWDMITLQQGSTVLFAGYESGMQKTQGYAKDLFAFIKEQFPLSQFGWQQTWAYQVGYNRSNGTVPDKATQDAYHERIKKMSQIVASENNVTLIPSGDAWYLARQNPVVGDTLCAKLDRNNGLGDYYHDGDIGGGQYLNACVWFEMLTGQSCIGNSYRPDYELSEEKITALQQAAHTTVIAR